jgi:PAS domain S-box-containing protein
MLAMEKHQLNYEKLKQKTKHLEGVVAAQNSIISNIPTLILELNEKGDCLDIWAHNPDELTAKKERLIGRNVSEILPFKATSRVMESLKEAKRKGQSRGQQIQLETPKGKMWFELSTNLEVNNNSTPPKFIMLSHDITKRKQAEI